jgi:uncharacterized protein YjbI with pentapeptide repeats
MADELETGSERQLAGNKTDEQVCSAEMGRGGRKCGRPLHTAPQGSDEKPVCLMHSKDPNKSAGELFEAFWREFEMVLEGGAHFEGFRFPKLDLEDRLFGPMICRFEGATFMQNADFTSATFAEDVDFAGTTFTLGARFSGTTFKKKADFTGATFTQKANFHSATFGQAYFGRATFGNVNFTHAIFDQVVDFTRATFEQGAPFPGATFRQNADFTLATFTKEASFKYATFEQDASFPGATFTESADFEETGFRGTVRWGACRFLESAIFRRAEFAPEHYGMPSAVFAVASLSYPQKIIFDDVDLSHALFHNCDVSEVWFTSSVRWAKRGSNGVAVFDESVPLEHARSLQRGGERDYRAIAQLYQQLKKNYDSRLDYWTANEFHFGEMEMKRLATPTEGPVLWLRRPMHRWLSLTAWYRYASDYGNSYRKPMLWLLAMLVLFALLFPLPGVGLRQTGTSYTETYSSVWHAGAPLKKSFQWAVGLFGKSMIVTVDTATFQRNPEYAPVYPWGRVLAIAETLLTSTLFGLFLLAIRRQFRR